MVGIVTATHVECCNVQPGTCAVVVHTNIMQIPWCRYGEKRQRMVIGDTGVYDELFSYACPKFITASPPNFDAPGEQPC